MNFCANFKKQLVKLLHENSEKISGNFEEIVEKTERFLNHFRNILKDTWKTKKNCWGFSNKFWKYSRKHHRNLVKIFEIFEWFVHFSIFVYYNISKMAIFGVPLLYFWGRQTYAPTDFSVWNSMLHNFNLKRFLI